MLHSSEAPACGNPAADFHVCRLTGCATFKTALLAKHGKLMTICQHKLSSHSVDDLAAHLQQELEAAVGGSLEACGMPLGMSSAPLRIYLHL